MPQDFTAIALPERTKRAHTNYPNQNVTHYSVRHLPPTNRTSKTSHSAVSFPEKPPTSWQETGRHHSHGGA
jgi:hypothetical protein